MLYVIAVPQILDIRKRPTPASQHYFFGFTQSERLNCQLPIDGLNFFFSFPLFLFFLLVVNENLSCAFALAMTIVKDEGS